MFSPSLYWPGSNVCRHLPFPSIFQPAYKNFTPTFLFSSPLSPVYSFFRIIRFFLPFMLLTCFPSECRSHSFPSLWYCFPEVLHPFSPLSYPLLKPYFPFLLLMVWFRCVSFFPFPSLSKPTSPQFYAHSPFLPPFKSLFPLVMPGLAP